MARKVPIRGRAADERLVEWLRLRREGVSLRRIAARFGVADSAVAAATKDVREADRLETDAHAPKGLRFEEAYW